MNEQPRKGLSGLEWGGKKWKRVNGVWGLGSKKGYVNEWN